jgi:hypothetical protein
MTSLDNRDRIRYKCSSQNLIIDMMSRVLIITSFMLFPLFLSGGEPEKNGSECISTAAMQSDREHS